MGHIRNLLSSRIVTSESGYQHFVMEAAENVHIHWRDTRIQMLPEDFEKLKLSVDTAYSMWVDKGKPIQNDANINLGEPFKCKDPGFFCDKFTIEEQQTDGIHIHWRDTRIHSDVGHFLYFAGMVSESVIAFKLAKKERVKFSSLIKPAITKVYDEWLNDYLRLGIVANADDVVRLSFEKSRYLTDNKLIPEDLDKKLLFSIYESIKRYGYAQGPYYGDYIECWKTSEGIYMAAAHRWSILNKLGYDEVDVCIIPPPDPSQIVNK